MKIVSLNAGCAWNLRFLDREEEIIYPWTKRGLWLVNKSEQWEREGTDDMGRILSCPRCQKDGIFRSHPQSPREHLASFLFVAPFLCPSCGHRFLASRLWLDHPTHSIDRREHLRIPVRLYLSFSGGKVRGEGTVLDLSMGGCIIKSETQVHTDDIFYLQLSLGEGEPPLELAAMVRSVSPRGIAFKFLRAAQENKRLLAFVQAQTADQPNKSSGKVGAAA
jgi:hypothetical protein